MGVHTSVSPTTFSLPTDTHSAPRFLTGSMTGGTWQELGKCKCLFYFLSLGGGGPGRVPSLPGICRTVQARCLLAVEHGIGHFIQSVSLNPYHRVLGGGVWFILIPILQVSPLRFREKTHVIAHVKGQFETIVQRARWALIAPCRGNSEEPGVRGASLVWGCSVSHLTEEVRLGAREGLFCSHPSSLLCHSRAV